jgi:hypothetical protein
MASAKRTRRRAKKKPAEPKADCAPETGALKPSGVKVPDDRESIEGRAEWFRRRTGQG